MAKSAKTAIKGKDKSADSKNYTKVVRTIKNSKSGAYTFKESMVHKDKIKDFLGS